MILMVKLQGLIFRRKSILDHSPRDLAHLELHHLLQVDVADIVHDPFDLYMVYVDSWGHAQVVDDFVGHQVHVLARIGHHHLVG